MYPDVASSLGLVWALAAIAWGAVFVAAAELTTLATEEMHMAAPPPYPDTGEDTIVVPGRGSPSTSRWPYVFGIIALILVVLFAIQHLTGGGLGGHTP
jgi:hypothetical protein